jgi:hypothetical protein
VSKLGAVGCRVIIPFRGDEVHARHLKPMGDLGGINFCPVSIRSLPDIQHAVADSNVVVNLLGKHYETRCPCRRYPRPPPAPLLRDAPRPPRSPQPMEVR